MTPLLLSFGALAVMGLLMLIELRHSKSNERVLLRSGAIEPPDPAYGVMRWVYPLAFVAMAVEGALAGRAAGAWTIAGVVVLGLGKTLKYWAIASLGSRWTYRVLVLPEAPLVRTGPYRLMRHPNYVGVLGELVGMAMMVQAPVTGTLGTAVFGALLRRRIMAEEAAGGAIPAGRAI